VPRQKFRTGEQVQMLCYHRREGRVAHDWLSGTVIQTDDRMLAVRFDVDVYSNQGWPVPDRILWCAHGSPRIRRPGAASDRDNG
jgi:hypothetical protein